MSAFADDLPHKNPELQRAQEQEALFFETISDMPAMQGLIELPDDSVRFDKPGGQIVEMRAVYFTPDYDAAILSLQDYYRTILPQMGWAPFAGYGGAKSTISFVREGEVLDIIAEKEARAVLLTFRVAPEPKAAGIKANQK